MSNLQYVTIDNQVMKGGAKQAFALSYQIFGQPIHQAPIVLVNHALTGNSDVAGEKGWWKSLIGEHQVIDLNRYTVIAFNIPGNGYDGKEENLLNDYQALTTKIIAELYWKALEKLKIKTLYALIGGSLGGSIAWEMAFQKPQAIQHLIPIACSAKASDWLIGNVLVQESILQNSKHPIEDARMHAMLLYRTPASLDAKFQKSYKENEGQYAVESWLKYHGDTLSKRFHIASYKVMNHLLKTIGEGTNIEDINKLCNTTTLHIYNIAVDTDYMFTKEEQKTWSDLLKKNKAKVSYQEIHSPHGHDAFLIEYDQLNYLLQPLFK